MLTDDEAAAVVLGLVAARQTGIATQGPLVARVMIDACAANGCSRVGR